MYSDPSAWDVGSGAIHSVGLPISDNLLYVPGSEGHSLSNDSGTGLGDVLIDTTDLEEMDPDNFLPVDEAIGLIAPVLIDFFVDDEATDTNIEGTASADTLLGDEGDNLIEGLAGNDVIEGLAGDDVIEGGDGHDQIFGGSGDDFIFGGAGDDVLTGNGGADTLDGGAGNDWLNGGWGYDDLIGGTGADRFYHHGVETGFGTEWIHDFSDAEGDKLVTQANGTADDFVVNFATTPGRGSDDIAEAFIRYVPTGQIAWVLQDGADLDEITIKTADGTFDLL
ncbi:RTX toxin/Ca2+-binding protein [Sulfitobacter donghicola DSW-25 = KCTC 12864 = JCM 14565]|nr:calcium-binding protein [Sulfitobacter donghicola]KIN69856.1 RTX toxin/Ca2+-binding protein [Sulfitobacter donghicola DSW-25 = KCTC 12864 = JCM 14565]